MVVVVQRVAKIYSRIARPVSGGRNEALPGGIVHQWKLLLVGREPSKGRLELREALGCQVRLIADVVHRPDDARELAEGLAGKVHGVQVRLGALRRWC